MNNRIEKQIIGVCAPKLAAMTLLLACLTPAISTATVIYFDDFTGMNSGTGAFTTLNNRTPPTTTDSANWNSGGYISNDGVDFVSMNTANNHSAFLPFVPENGFLYTLTVRMGHSSGANETTFASMGFNLNVSPLTTQTFAGNNGLGHVAIRRNGEYNWWAGPQTTGSTIGNTALAGFTENTFYEFRLELDTRPDNWTLDLFVAGNQVDLNGASPGMSHVYTTTPTIRHIQLSSNAGTSIYDSVQLTVIPEPGTLLLVGVALATLCIFRRRKT
jgi:hypothetical protein